MIGADAFPPAQIAPSRGIGRCARAVSGQATAPPSIATKPRRLISLSTRTQESRSYQSEQATSRISRKLLPRRVLSPTNDGAGVPLPTDSADLGRLARGR